MTYNHEKYIRDTLDGFIKQQTDFSFVAIIHDDASTDRTASIVKEYADEYPNIILPIFEKENQYRNKNAPTTTIVNSAIDCSGVKYIAFCEGDDYWIDSLKLQKQVDALEADVQYAMSATAYKRFYALTGTFENIDFINKIDFKLLFNGNVISTATTVIKYNIYKEYLKTEFYKSIKQAGMGDIPLWLYISYNYRINYISDITTVYRILPKSASHSNIINWLQFIISACDIRQKFCNYHSLPYPQNNQFTILIYKFCYTAINSDKKDNTDCKKMLKDISIRDLSIRNKILKCLFLLNSNLIVKYIKVIYNNAHSYNLYYNLFVKLRKYFH